MAELVSERYADPEGRDKDSLRDLIARTLSPTRSLHLWFRIDAVAATVDHGTATVLVAMAAHPIAGLADLRSVDADLYRFELELAREDGVWRVTAASWRRATPSDLL